MNYKVAYRHRRNDTNEIFYIGIGSVKRANDSVRRSKWWKKIVAKAGYKVEIIAENLVWDDACELESLLIYEYGRKDKNKGNLVNLTDGGEGTPGCKWNLGRKATDEHKNKISVANKGKKLSSEHKRKISQTHNSCRYIIRNCENNEIYYSTRDAAIKVGVAQTTIRRWLANPNKAKVKFEIVQKGKNR